MTGGAAWTALGLQALVDGIDDRSCMLQERDLVDGLVGPRRHHHRLCVGGLDALPLE